MKSPTNILVAALLLVLLAPAGARAGDPDGEDVVSPVGRWRLDRDSIQTGLEDETSALLVSLFVPDMEFRIFEDGRFETWTRMSGFDGEGQISTGTWIQSRRVLSFAALRDDGQPGSVIGRLREDGIALAIGQLELLLVNIPEEVSEAPAETEPAFEPEAGIGGGIGVGPGPSIRIPRIGPETEAWPPLAITSANRVQVAKRTGRELIAAVAKEQGTTPEALWDGITEDAVVHIRSGYDSIDRILEAWNLPHVTVTPLEFLERGRALLEKARVVLIPCMDPLPRALASGLGSALRSFVENGGYLATTDWSVKSVLEPAFPELVTSRGRLAPIPESMCPSWIPPAAAGSEPALVRGLGAIKNVDVWCEQSAFAFSGPEGEAGATLLATNKLHLDFQGQRRLAFAAVRGRGKILHALPQLFQEKGTPAGARTMQRLFLNFVREGLGFEEEDS